MERDGEGEKKTEEAAQPPAATSSTWSERLEQGPVSAIRRLPKSQAARPRVQCQHSQLTEGNRDDTARNCVQEQLWLLYRNHLCTAAPKLQANLPTGGADNVSRKETVSTQARGALLLRFDD